MLEIEYGTRSLDFLFLEQRTQVEVVTQREQFVGAGAEEGHVVCQIHHGLTLDHVVVGLAQCDGLLEDGSLGDSCELAQHLHLHPLYTQPRVLPLCLFHGDETDVIGDFAQTVDFLDDDWLVVSLFAIERERMCFWLLVGASNQEDVMALVDYCDQFHVEDVVVLEGGAEVVLSEEVGVVEEARAQAVDESRHWPPHHLVPALPLSVVATHLLPHHQLLIWILPSPLLYLEGDDQRLTLPASSASIHQDEFDFQRVPDGDVDICEDDVVNGGGQANGEGEVDGVVVLPPSLQCLQSLPGGLVYLVEDVAALQEVLAISLLLLVHVIQGPRPCLLLELLGLPHEHVDLQLLVGGVEEVVSEMQGRVGGVGGTRTAHTLDV